MKSLAEESEEKDWKSHVRTYVARQRLTRNLESFLQLAQEHMMTLLCTLGSQQHDPMHHPADIQLP